MRLDKTKAFLELEKPHILRMPARHQHRQLFHSAEEEVDQVRTLPEIICLCGSTRFLDKFHEANLRFTLQAKIVLGPGYYGHSAHAAHAISARQKDVLDALHFRKIDLAFRVHVLNIDGYVGRSTHNEIMYAVRKSKIVTFEENMIRPWDTTHHEKITTRHYMNAIDMRLRMSGEGGSHAFE